ALEPDILFTDDAAAQQVASTTLTPTRVGAMVIGAFGGLALLLAAIGLYGVIAYSVTRRTREIGIRLALGAARSRVVRMGLFPAGRLALVGIGLGALLSAGVGRLIGSLLYGVSAFDPLAYGISAAVMLVVAIAANLVPALAAARIDPLRSLRAE